MFILVCAWFVGTIHHFFIWGNVYVMSIVLVTHAVPFSKQENLRSRAACISSSESECSQNGGSSSESKCS